MPGDAELLHAQGKLTGSTEYTVPAADTAYRLTVDNSRDAAVYPVSTRVHTEWTFRSAKTPESEFASLPLSTVRFSPELTLASTAKAGSVSLRAELTDRAGNTLTQTIERACLTTP